MKSICVIVPYFGTWPPWFPLYLESCRWNTTIRWLFFTDCDPPANSPGNVDFLKGSLVDFAGLASEALGIADLKVASPYKVCDFKPALGLIFQEYIAGFDYWAHGDIDVIYGDLRGKLTDQLLKYRVISMHRRYISGHLTLYRNDSETNKMFKKVQDWRSLLAASENRKFDEVHFVKAFGLQYFEKGMREREWDGAPVGTEKGFFFHEAWSTPRFYLNHKFSLRRVRWRGLRANKRWDGQNQIPDVWYWRDGKLWNNVDRCERPYLHFMHWAREDWKCTKQILNGSVDLMASQGFRVDRFGCSPLAARRPGLSVRVPHHLCCWRLRIVARMRSLANRIRWRIS